jgi:hypothetical protein
MKHQATAAGSLGRVVDDETHRAVVAIDLALLACHRGEPVRMVLRAADDAKETRGTHPAGPPEQAQLAILFLSVGPVMAAID